MVNCELLFNVVWKIVSPFLDTKTTDKIKNIYPEDLLKYVDEDELLEDLGGTLGEPPLEELLKDHRFTYKSYIQFLSEEEIQT